MKCPQSSKHIFHKLFLKHTVIVREPASFKLSLIVLHLGIFSTRQCNKSADQQGFLTVTTVGEHQRSPNLSLGESYTNKTSN